MIRGLAYRITITCVNILFPPLAVMLVAGGGWDCILNCILFLCAVIPSHIHGFYVTCTYFHRRHKVKKGRYPGGSKYMITSKNILNGGASDREVNRLWREEHGEKRRRRQSDGSSMSGRNAEKISPRNGYGKDNGYSPVSPVSSKNYWR